MTFNQWVAKSASNLPPSARCSLEDVWNQLQGGGASGEASGRLLEDLIRELEEVHRDRYRRW